MKLKFLDLDLSVAKLPDMSGIDPAAGFFFLSRTPSEISLVCLSDDVPKNAAKVETGWRAFHVEGTLDFGLVGILSRLTGLLAERNIPVFAMSTYDTDYVLFKADKEKEVRAAMKAGGVEME